MALLAAAVAGRVLRSAKRSLLRSPLQPLHRRAASSKPPSETDCRDLEKPQQQALAPPSPPPPYLINIAARGTVLTPTPQSAAGPGPTEAQHPRQTAAAQSQEDASNSHTGKVEPTAKQREGEQPNGSMTPEETFYATTPSMSSSTSSTYFSSSFSSPSSIFNVASDVRQTITGHTATTRKPQDTKKVNRHFCPSSVVEATTSTSQVIDVTLGSGEVLELPLLLLRDQCRCGECFHTTTFQRRVGLRQSLASVQSGAPSVEVSPCGTALDVVWADGHHSRYAGEFLQHVAPGPERCRVRSSEARGGDKVPWTRASLEAMARQAEQDGVRYTRRGFASDPACVTRDAETAYLPQFVFQQVLEDPTVQLAWLQALSSGGAVILTDVPPQNGQVERLAKKVCGYLRETVYGRFFSVVAQVDPNNQAYTSDALPLHTDLPYYSQPPSVQVLHCLQEAGAGDGNSGGESLLVDGCAVALRLRDVHPEKYQLLRDTPCVFDDYAPGSYFLRHEHPVIVEDELGMPIAVNYNNGTRAAVFNAASAQDATDWFLALAELDYILEDSSFVAEFRLRRGMAMCFDNRRVLHGRRAFHLGLGRRELEGGYIEFDELRSRERILKIQRQEQRGEGALG